MQTCLARTLALALCCLGAILVPVAEPAEKIPLLYSTDLFHPHDDPDDHYDLATLFSISEFDIHGIIVEHGEKQAKRPGRIPVEQMIRLTGRSPAWSGSTRRSVRLRTTAAPSRRNSRKGSS
jgi:predicted class III extradiol MEMO1 family dioxygenase